MTILTTTFHETIDQNTYAFYESFLTKYRPSRSVTYELATHYHPYTDELIERLNRHGLAALLDASWQETLDRPLAPNRYVAGPKVSGEFPRHQIDVSDTGPYAIYNWELFFHVPVLVATHLSKNQRFTEAQQWFHHVFDPTSTDETVPVPERFWNFLRFRQETAPESIGERLTKLAEGTDPELVAQVKNAITDWRNAPFRPHVVARSRAFAYQLNVVMRYLDNLLAWGDSLFRQDTVESMNEATQIYVLAANILGPKPQEVPRRATVQSRSYAQLRAEGIDAFGNALVELENEFPFDLSGVPATGDPSATAAFGIGRSLYFCIPPNDQLLRYWHEVGDRLFKLRHCINIEGVVRLPALFDPPIDPGALVKAVAAGIDIASIVNNVNQPVSTLRGRVLLGRAKELAREVSALGAAMLLAVEKEEAEQLATLRRTHELAVLNMVRDVRFLQWKQAVADTDALLASRATTWERFRHYKRILGAEADEIDAVAAVNLARAELTEDTFDLAYRELVEAHTRELGREAYRKETTVGGLMEFAGEAVVEVVGGEQGETLPLNKNEHAELNIFLPSADAFDTLATIMNISSKLLGLIPQFGAAAKPMGVGAEVGFGGVQLSKAAEVAGDVAEKVATAFKESAARASKLAGYYRRAEDFVLQANLASSELEQFGRQIITSLIREQILKREYETHVRQIEHAEEVDVFHRDKFTTAELYGWMHGQLSKVHYDSYKLAFDLAKRAEATLSHEIMRPEFDGLGTIQFGYWDAGRRGLLAGEQLELDLHRLELAADEHDRREYELTGHVSLARLDPRALLRLKATGACEVTIPEWLFDLDSPGQYMRRIKTVALTIPAVTGPYTTVHAKLSLLRSTIRTSSLTADGYARQPGEDGRFRDFTGAIQSVVTSSAQNDSGLFEVDLGDPRRLPFEGAGAESTWRIELPSAIPQFDHETITDVILHIRYTAREAGHLAADAVQHLRDDVLSAPAGLERLYTLPHEFSDAWFAFRSAEDDADRVLALSVDQSSFPYWVSRLGMDDALEATFAVVDLDRARLSLAPAAVALDGDAGAGWTLTVDQASPVFAFLKRHLEDTVHMTVAYAAAG